MTHPSEPPPKNRVRSCIPAALGFQVIRVECSLHIERGAVSGNETGAQRRGRGHPIEAYARRYRSRVVAAAHPPVRFTLGAIAEHFGVHYTTVSRTVRWVESEKKDDV